MTTRFLPKNVCEMLEKLGCKSESNFYWREGFKEPSFSKNGFNQPVKQAFDKLDVLEKGNAKKIFGKDDWVCSRCGNELNHPTCQSQNDLSHAYSTSKVYFLRHHIIDFHGDEWAEVVRKAASEAIGRKG